jgi:hypothetical protein
MTTWTNKWMKTSPWEANCCSATIESSSLWNPRLHYPVHECPRLVPILSHMTAEQVLPSSACTNQFDVLGLGPGIPSGLSLFQVILPKSSTHPSLMRSRGPAHLTRLHLTALTASDEPRGSALNGSRSSALCFSFPWIKVRFVSAVPNMRTLPLPNSGHVISTNTEISVGLLLDQAPYCSPFELLCFYFRYLRCLSEDVYPHVLAFCISL